MNCSPTKLFPPTIAAALVLSVSGAWAQAPCDAALPAYSAAMKAGTVHALEEYLAEHEPCFAAPVRRQLDMLRALEQQTSPQAAEQGTSESGSGLERVGSASADLCGARADLRSDNSDSPVTVRFLNQTDQRLVVNWIDYGGDIQPYGEVAPGGVFEQQTFLTHPWQFNAPDGSCVHVVMPKSGQSDYSITGGG